MLKLTSALKLLVFMVIISCGPQPVKQVEVVGAYSGISRWDVSGSTTPALSVRVDSALATQYGNSIYTVIDDMKEKWDVEVPDTEFFASNSQANQVADPGYANIRDYYYAEASSNFGIYLRNTDDGWFTGVSTSALAVTQYFGTVNPAGFLKIIHSDIFINETVHNFKISPGHLEGYHLPTVLLHELGHFLGLSHSNQLLDVMYPSLGLYNAHTGSGDKSDLGDGDKETILNLYSGGGSVSSLNSQGFIVGHQSSGNEETVYRGVIELHADGECRHYFNEKLVEVHSSKVR